MIKSRVKMRNQMLQFLNSHYKAFNEDAAYELPKYLTEPEAEAEAAGLKDNEEDADVKSFGEDDL